MEVPAPVGGDPAVRAWHRLLPRVAVRAGQRRARLVEVLVRVRPEPGLPRLEAADDRVAGLLGVRGGVLGRRGVTAPDVAALSAAAQVQPPPALGFTLDAAGAARLDRRVDAWHLLGHDSSGFSWFCG